MKNTIIIAILLLIFTTINNAQDNTDFGLSNDLMVSHSVNKKVTVFAGAKIESRTNSTQIQEQRYYGGVGYKYGKWNIQGSLIVVELAAKYWEQRPVLSVSRRFDLSKDKSWSITPGFRTEFRIRPGVNKFRFVPTLRLEKKFNPKYSGFITMEYYRDLRNTDVTNHWKRFYFGVNRNINKKLSVDMFYLFQKAENGPIIYNHKLGLTWRVKL